MSIVYDAGVLIAADRNDRQAWADHRARLELDRVPTTTAPVLAQVSRSPHQVQLRRFVRGCHIESFRRDQAHDVGSLLGRVGTADIVDAHVVIVAAALGSPVLTADPKGLQRLSRELASPVEIRVM